MSILSALNPISGIVQAVTPLVERFTTTPGESADAEVKLRGIAIAESREADRPMAEQRAINLAEARHSSVFVAGWRPFVGWVAGIGLAILIIVWPLATLVVTQVGGTMPPLPIDPEVILVVLGSLLGVSKIGRSYEKTKGVARNSIEHP